MQEHRVDPKNNPIVQEYVLPDLSTNRRGRIRQPDDIVTETDQILVMNNERFAVPEILFHPDDIGIFSPHCLSFFDRNLFKASINQALLPLLDYLSQIFHMISKECFGPTSA
jgi:Actin